MGADFWGGVERWEKGGLGVDIFLGIFVLVGVIVCL